MIASNKLFLRDESLIPVSCPERPQLSAKVGLGFLQKNNLVHEPFQVVVNSTHVQMETMVDNVSKVVKDVNRVAQNVSHMAEDVNELAENVDQMAENVEDMVEDVRNSTRLLNECVKKHLGVPLLNDWYQWGMDILKNQVPAESEFFRPSSLGEWLHPQYLMMLISYAICHILSWIDARCGSKISKHCGFKQSGLVKVKSETKLILLWSDLVEKKSSRIVGQNWSKIWFSTSFFRRV